VVSTRVFAALTDYLWKLTYKWACWSHPNKPRHWIIGRYFGKFSKFRNDQWGGCPGRRRTLSVAVPHLEPAEW
jgi:RNA-directed DNA polymerase